MVIRLHRRRRRSEDDQRTRLLGANDRDVAAVVTRRFFLLVRRIVLFVDNDQTDTLERREYRRPRADDDVDGAAADALPLIVPFAIGQTAVLDGDAIAKRLTELRGGSRRQGDL